MAALIGIDPGLANTGWAIIDSDKKEIVKAGCIKTKTQDAIDKRLLFIHTQLNEIIKTFSPSVASMEKTFVNSNAASSLVLAEARGALMLTLAMSGLEIYEYQPNVIKNTITGVGHCNKLQISYVIERTFPNFDLPANKNATDAIAIALCHFYMVMRHRKTPK